MTISPVVIYVLCMYIVVWIITVAIQGHELSEWVPSQLLSRYLQITPFHSGVSKTQFCYFCH